MTSTSLKISIGPILALLAFTHPPVASAQYPTEAWVSVRQELMPDGRAKYHYRVTNKSEQRIVAFVVGYNYLLGEPQLNNDPDGWTVDGGAPAGVLAAPVHWMPKVILTEECETFEIEFRNKGNPSADVFAGQSLGGFSVVVPRPSPEYMNSHFTIIFGDSSVGCDRILLEGKPRINVMLGDLPRMRGERFSITLYVSNTGTGDAREINLSRVTLRTLLGTGTALLEGPPVPIRLDDLPHGAETNVQLNLYVPLTVRKLSIIEQGSLYDSGGTKLSFSSAQVMYRKAPAQ